MRVTEEIDVARALTYMRPNSGWVMRGDKIEWLDTTQTQPTDAEIQTEITRLQADYDSKQYQRDRKYPSLADQADMQYWDSVNNTTVWLDTIAAIKASFPKE